MKGAFTGANENRQGLFAAAHGGTLFMDEISNMPISMQMKLYRVLQEGRVRPLGSTDEIEINVRVIGATNKDLEKEIAEGRFREDLYYRLNVIPIHLPPLRERRDDIPLLARTFLERFRESMKKPVEGISPDAMQLLENYEWPGNVRELENIIERSVALESAGMVSAGVLPDKIRQRGSYGSNGNGHSNGNGNGNGHAASNGTIAIPPGGMNLEQRIADIEREYLTEALKMSDGVGTRAADLLHITYRSFRHYAKKYNL
jgi:two-component system response regulator PilR (NtrC family)